MSDKGQMSPSNLKLTTAVKGRSRAGIKRQIFTTSSVGPDRHHRGRLACGPEHIDRDSLTAPGEDRGVALGFGLANVLNPTLAALQRVIAVGETSGSRAELGNRTLAATSPFALGSLWR